jgi:hypothetical protein
MRNMQVQGHSWETYNLFSGGKDIRNIRWATLKKAIGYSATTQLVNTELQEEGSPPPPHLGM